MAPPGRPTATQEAAKELDVSLSCVVGASGASSQDDEDPVEAALAAVRLFGGLGGQDIPHIGFGASRTS